MLIRLALTDPLGEVVSALNHLGNPTNRSQTPSSEPAGLRFVTD